MDGGDRAGYMQIADVVDSQLITDTMGAITGQWANFEVISSQVQISSIIAPAMAGSSLIDSGTTWEKGARFACAMITSIKISAKSSNTAVIAHERILK